MIRRLFVRHEVRHSSSGQISFVFTGRTGAFVQGATWPTGQVRSTFVALGVGLLLLASSPAHGQEPITNRHPVWGSDGRIYFQSDRDGDREVYSMDADGADQQRLTRRPGEDYPPFLAPDGSRAVFMARRGEDFDLYLMNPDGNGIEPLVTRAGDDWDPAWSPDGRSIAWMATSPDGDRELYRMDLDDGEPERLTEHEGMDAYPDWDPDGRSLVYIRMDGDSEIFEMRFDGTEPRNLTRNPAGDYGPRISPDGSRIAFFSDRAGDFEIYIMNRDGSDPRRLTHDGGKDIYVTWSPDAEWLAFESDRTGTPEIYRIRPDGTGLRQLTEARGPADAAETPQKGEPRVAILVYDGVQVIDHAIPYEVFGQFSLNEVYTVAKNPGEITTYMGMRIMPNHTFVDAPEPDVLVLPGGDAGDAVDDPEIQAWIRRTAASADHVLTICTGTFFLVGTDLLDGARITTWYDRQAELARAAPTATVVSDSIVVESGKLVTAAGLGVEGSLRVLERLHGPGWAEVVRLNMEHEPVPAQAHVPRADLADLNLPDAVYGAFPWREAELVRFEGDRDAWAMTWRFASDVPADTLRAALVDAIADGWNLEDEERAGATWRSEWSLTGTDGEPWGGEVSLRPVGGVHELDLRVRRVAEPCESTDPAWSPDGARIAFTSNCEGESLELFVMDADGSNRTRLTRTPAMDHTPAFSPDGARIAFSRHVEGEDPEIWTMAPDGSGARPLTDNEATDYGPAWSPAGGRIAFESTLDGNADIRMVDVVTGAETRLTDHPARDLDPAWSPDGAWIAFQSDRGGRYGIWAVPAGGGEARSLVEVQGHAAGPSWAPDGTRLVFAHLADERDGDLAIAAPDSNPVPLTSGPRSDFAPSWSPDGRAIVFIGREEGEAWDVWTVPAAGGEPTRLTSGGAPAP